MDKTHAQNGGVFSPSKLIIDTDPGIGNAFFSLSITIILNSFDFVFP